MSLPKRDNTANDYKQRLLRVLDCIEARLDEGPTLAELADVAAFNPFHFHHVFRGMAGESVMDTVRRLRLERAWQCLRDGGATVANIALDSGYSAEESFIRAFKAQFGLTPGEARTQPPPEPGGTGPLRLRIMNFNAMLGVVMEHSVVELDAFDIVGLGLDCPGFNGSDIGELWGQLFARTAEVQMGGRMIGLSLPRQDGFYYIAGTETDPGRALPEGMQRACIPAGRYFKVPFHDKAEKMSTVFGPIFSQMLPAAGLTPAEGGVCFEDYPPNCMDEAAGTLKCDLYVLVV